MASPSPGNNPEKAQSRESCLFEAGLLGALVGANALTIVLIASWLLGFNIPGSILAVVVIAFWILMFVPMLVVLRYEWDEPDQD